MINPLDPIILIFSVVVTALLFALTAFVTRAGPRRILGALIGSLPIIPLVMFFDVLAERIGYWHYPSVTTGNGPLAWYIAAALFYGAALGLVGWRVFRRFGSAGLLFFLAACGVFGVTRDVAYSITSRLIVFGSGPLPLVADFFAYISCAALVQLLMYWIAGPPGSDALARTA